MNLIKEIFQEPAYLVCVITMLNAWLLGIYNKRYKAAEEANKPIFENPDIKPREKTLSTIKKGLDLYRQGLVTCFLNIAILILCGWWLLGGALPRSRFEIFAIAILPLLIWKSADVATDLWRTRRSWRALRLFLEMAKKQPAQTN